MPVLHAAALWGDPAMPPPRPQRSRSPPSTRGAAAEVGVEAQHAGQASEVSQLKAQNEWLTQQIENLQRVIESRDSTIETRDITIARLQALLREHEEGGAPAPAPEDLQAEPECNDLKGPDDSSSSDADDEA